MIPEDVNAAHVLLGGAVFSRRGKNFSYNSRIDNNQSLCIYKFGYAGYLLHMLIVTCLGIAIATSVMFGYLTISDIYIYSIIVAPLIIYWIVRSLISISISIDLRSFVAIKKSTIFGFTLWRANCVLRRQLLVCPAAYVRPRVGAGFAVLLLFAKDRGFYHNSKILIACNTDKEPIDIFCEGFSQFGFQSVECPVLQNVVLMSYI